MIEISQDAARAALVAAQGLEQKKQKRVTKADVLKMIRQIHFLQIDTISVVARSPYLVLWSRVGSYEAKWLDELLAEGKIFEYWAHAACFLPSDDYPLYRRLILDEYIWNGKHWRHWADNHQEMVAGMLAHIREKGAVRAADFERTDGVKGIWWNWKDEKMALEHLFFMGDVMIAKRQGFQRVYDLRERVMPNWDDSQAPSADSVYRTFVLNAVKALGVTKAAWVTDYFRAARKATLATLKTLADEGALQTVKVEGWDVPGYVHPENMKLIEGKKLPMSKTTLLSPFDPIVADRARGSELFGFDYLIECYTPEAKRKYGYFTLPILYKNQLIGRLDPKAHRKEGRFEVKALHFEPGVVVDDELIVSLREAIRACADWHQTPEVVVRAGTMPEVAKALMG